LNHEKKKHAEITLEEVIKLRDQQIEQMEKMLPQLPPETRKQVEAQLKAIKGDGKPKKQLELKSLGKKDKVNGYNCELYTWSAADCDGEACIADKSVGVDPAPFKKATEKMSEKLS